MKKQNGLDYFQKVSMLWSICFGIASVVRGAYWVFNANTAQHESNLYDAMHDVLPLTFWGLPFAVSGILLIVSGFLTPYYQTSINYFRFNLSGYAIACPFYYIFSVAGFNNSLNIVTPVINFNFAIISGAIAYIAYRQLRELKKQKHD
ncbi:hypothetical protein [Staphylococcus simulans]|uniref:hypothetical protein n=1 Tax=Staphylococcus simulans TaxID=1286 RepID=UPI00070F074E|nr:hypothetical protein [Staphylococcus simulans]